MVIQLHRAERADTLVAGLGALLADPLPDPFATEIVCVPTPGIERWLSQELSRRLGAGPGEDGVCIGVDFPSPRALAATIARSVLPDTPDTDPWTPERLVWPLLRVVEASRGEPWARLLWSYLGVRGAELGRRWATARRLAELFSRYAAVRPGMLSRWRDGLDTDADGVPLAEDRAWQPELWRRVRAEVGGPDPLERLAAVVDCLQAGGVSELPERVSVFGVTRLDPQQLRIFAALAGQRDVHLWLPHPSPALWSRLSGELAAHPTRAGLRRIEDPSRNLARHQLLNHLGRDVRELQTTLAQVAGAGISDIHHPSPQALEGAPSLLTRLQADVAADRALGAPEQRWDLGPDDRSLTFHAAHGPDRQVEVLREVLVGLLADDPTLEPRDIVVMCPDIEKFAPLIAATFGLETAESEAEHPGHRLRVKLADRSLRQVNPLLAVVSQLVGLADGRMTASDLLDLIADPAVSRRFGFRDENLERLHELVTTSGVRWGLDPTQRARFGMSAFGQNTWAAGLDRLLLGVAMDEAEERFIGTVLPLDDVDSGDAALVGRLAECVTRLGAITADCRELHTAAEWSDLLRDALTQLTSVSSADTWQLTHAHGVLRRLATDAEDDRDDSAVALSLAEITAVLGDALRGQPSRASFRSGTLTMCTMLPMRSVPHRVVCLLGLDDGVFPRPVRVDGDDLTAVDERVGDRDPRSEDRQLLLDAIMSASQRLVVVYAGRDPRADLPTPPSVPVSELRQTVEAMSPGALDLLTIQHPLQPFDARNFAPGALVPAESFSFDRAALRGVRAVQRRVRPGGSAKGLSLPPLPADWQPNLADLVRFLAHPIRALLRDRAQLSSWSDDEPPDEQIPLEATGLERWQIGERVLRQRLRGRPSDALAAAEWRRGALPPRALGQRTINGVLEVVGEIADAATPFRVAAPDRYPIAVDVAGERFTGTVGEVHGTDLVRTSFSKLSAKARLQAWVELLALTTAYPDREWRAVVVGSGGWSVLGPLPRGAWAGLVLADLVDLQRVGLSEPIPFAARTSEAYAEARHRGRPLDSFSDRLGKTWEFDRDGLYEQFFGSEVTLEQLLKLPSIQTEERGDFAEPSRFGTLARRVFEPLLRFEEIR